MTKETTNPEEGKKKGGRPPAGRHKGEGTLERHGRTWRAVWVVNGRKFRRSTGTANRREAEKILAGFVEPFQKKTEERILEGLADKVQDIRRKDSPRLAELAAAFDCYMERKDRSPATLKHYRARLKVFSAWVAEKHPEAETMDDVDADMACEFDADILTPFAKKTHADYISILAMAWDRLAPPSALGKRNPWGAVEKPDGWKAGMQDRRVLEAEELEAVYKAAEGRDGGELRLLFKIGANTGLRLGDAAQLDWSAIDTRGAVWWIVLTPSKTERYGTEVAIDLKPGNGLRAELSRVPEARRSGPILPALSKLYARDDSQVSDKVQAVFEAAGIKTLKKRKHGIRKAVVVGYHALRHTFILDRIEAGEPLAKVAKMVGHLSQQQTDKYLQLARRQSKPAQSRAAAAVEAFKAFCTGELAGAGLSPADWREVSAALAAARANKKS